MKGQLSITDMPGFREWQYDEETGNVMCRCPVCSGRLLIGLYTYGNIYKYCPYCGEKLREGNITAKRKQVYRLKQEDAGRKDWFENPYLE